MRERSKGSDGVRGKASIAACLVLVLACAPRAERVRDAALPQSTHAGPADGSGHAYGTTTRDPIDGTSTVLRPDGSADARASEVPIDDGATTVRFDVAGSTIELAILPAERVARDAEIRAWVEQSARAVAGYYGRFPTQSLSVRVLATRGRAVRNGSTRGTIPISIAVALGDRADARAMARDWVMTHEMIHAAMPSLAEEHHWLEEGIATYVEPIARARAGLVREEEVWREWMRDYPQGLPGADDRGLDRASGWGRTYYGGAIFCLLADVEIRRRTRNASSLQDALVAIVAAGGDLSTSWPIARVIEVGDAATGTTVLEDHYARFGLAGGPIDLESLWSELGLSLRGRTIVTDDDAPLSAVRRALVGG